MDCIPFVASREHPHASPYVASLVKLQKLGVAITGPHTLSSQGEIGKPMHMRWGGVCLKLSCLRFVACATCFTNRSLSTQAAGHPHYTICLTTLPCMHVCMANSQPGTCSMSRSNSRVDRNSTRGEEHENIPMGASSFFLSCMWRNRSLLDNTVDSSPKFGAPW